MLSSGTVLGHDMFSLFLLLYTLGLVFKWTDINGALKSQPSHSMHEYFSTAWGRNGHLVNFVSNCLLLIA